MTSVQDTQKPLFINYEQWLKPRTVYQKSIILSIIWDAHPRLRQREYIFQFIRTYNFWVTWLGLRNIARSASFCYKRKAKKRLFFKISSDDEAAGLRIPRNSFLYMSDIRCKPENLCRWLNWHEFAIVCSQRGPPNNEGFFFFSFWTNFRKKWEVL